MENDELGDDRWIELRSIELKILDLITKLEESGPKIEDDIVNLIASNIGDFSKKLRELSDLYSQMDYFHDKKRKITFKARLKYAQRVIDLGSRLISSLDRAEVLDYFIESILNEYEQFLSEKESLLNGELFEIARMELEVFHDESFRDKLSKDLENKLKKGLNDIFKKRGQ